MKKTKSVSWRGLLACCCWWWCMILARGWKTKDMRNGVSRHIRSIGFPEGSGMGIFFALSVPVDIPDKTVLFSFYFEANYPLPNQWNSTYLGVEYLKKRSLDRRLAYSVLEYKLESAGLAGEACLLKTICEAADYPFARNGLLGDLLEILFRPSSSMDEDLPARISQAEKAGNCNERYAECTVSLLDIISHYSSEIAFPAGEGQ